MARAQGARSQLAIVFESTYGTAPASGFRKVPFVSSNLDAQQALQESELLGMGRDPLAPVLDAIDVDGDISIPVDAVNFGLWLKATFGSPTTTGSVGAYVHTFASDGWTLPSLAIETGLPEVPSFSMVTGARVNELSWDIGRKGLLAAKVALMAQGETTAGSSAAGTLTELALQRFTHFHGAITRDGAALGNLVGGSIKYSNNLDRIETVRSDGKIDGVDPGQTALSGQCVMRFADRTLLDQAIAGGTCALAMTYSIPSGPSLTFTAHAVTFSRPRREISGPGGVQVTFDWMASRAASPARMCTVVLSNAQATY